VGKLDGAAAVTHKKDMSRDQLFLLKCWVHCSPRGRKEGASVSPHVLSRH
jgi:hypothetical protein